jgi:peptide/nickel transport system substrate-binding protein
MRSRLFLLVSLLAIFSMLLAACQPAPAPEKIVETVIVEGKPVEVVVTATPQPEAGATTVPKVSPTFKNPDTFTMITGAGEPESLDPAWTYETAGLAIEFDIYEGLLVYKKSSVEEFVPVLATDWKASEDGKQYVFTIRKGVKFHKGGTLEPHDVAYTIARTLLQGRTDGIQWVIYEAFFGTDLAMASIKDFASAYMKKETFEDLSAADKVKVCEDIKSKVVADDAAGTVTFNLNQPVPWLFPIMSANFLGMIVDQEWMIENGDWDGKCDNWEKWADPEAQNTILFNQANGTGPYMLDHWTPGEETVLVANPDYWRTEPAWEGAPSGVAKIPRVVIKNIDEWGTRLAMFEAGDADQIYVPATFRPQMNPYVKDWCYLDETKCEVKNPDGYVKAFRDIPAPFITPAQLNWNINVEGGNPFMGSGKLDGNGIPANFFSDLHVRKAFNYCFDFDAMVNEALGGEGVQAQGPIPVGMMGYLEGQKPMYSYDPAKCEEEFKLADVNGDGVSADTDENDVWNKGFYMQIAYNTGNEVRRVSSEILKAGIEAVNPKFNIAVVGMPWPVMLESRRQGKLPVYVGGWIEDYHDPHNWANPFLYSQGSYGRVINLAPELQAQFDELILQGANESDPAKRKPIYEKIQTLAQENAVNIWMYQQTDGLHFQEWISGFFYNPGYGNPEPAEFYYYTKTAP